MDKLNPREDKIQMIYEAMDMGSPRKVVEIENYIRDTLSGTSRKTTAELLWPMCKKMVKGVNQDKFNKVWQSLIDDKYLVKAGGDDSYKWEK